VVDLSGIEAVEASVTRELFFDWLRHPVTKAVGLVLVATLAHELVLSYGTKLLGIAKDSTDGIA
jgi:hypothetical protein